MPFSTTLFAFCAASLLIELTPGPNMAYLAVISARDGRRTGLATVAGIALGLAVAGTVTAFGVAELLQASPLAYQVLRWGGVGYLFYLAWDGWRAPVGQVAGSEASTVKGFRRGFITNLLNPKAFVFYVSVLPAFIQTDRSPGIQVALLTAIYVAIATAVHSTIVFLAANLQPFLDDPRRERIGRRIMSAMLAAVAGWFLWSTAR